VSRTCFPFFFAALLLFLPCSCKTTPPTPESISTEESAGTVAGEKAAVPETPDEPPVVVVRAEEVIEPLDKDVDVDLAEPFYDLSEPDVAGALEEAPLVPDGSAGTIVLEEPVEKPEEVVAGEPAIAGESVIADESAIADEPVVPDESSDMAEAVTETVADEPPQSEPEEAEPPPPPPAAALRPSEPLASSPPVSRTPPAPLKAEPVLPARNPPTETARYIKPAVSRTINVKTYQTFEVPFAETGWVYTGEENSKNGIAYDSRRVHGDSQVFVFRAEKEGDYTLKFYKQDFLRDHVTNEYVRVIVEDEPPYVAAAPVQSSEAAADAETPPVEPPPAASPDELLRNAREAVAAQKYPEAIELLDRLEAQTELNDEAWWLYGQSFEAASPARDIRSALYAYSHIVRDYPQSRHYKNAQNRIAFLNRFYFNIR
jgi:hypothetical protein